MLQSNYLRFDGVTIIIAVIVTVTITIVIVFQMNFDTPLSHPLCGLSPLFFYIYNSVTAIMYSFDIRKVACHIYSIVKSLRKTALLVSVSHSSVGRWVNSFFPRAYRSTNRILKSDEIVDILRSAIMSNPLTCASRLKRIVYDAINLNVSTELIRTVIRDKLQFSHKKARFCGRPKNQSEKVHLFIKSRNSFLKQGKNIVSIDETAFGRFSHNHVSGYSPIGKPLYVSKIRPRMDTTSVVACVSPSGLLGSKTLVNKAFNSESFLEFLNSLSLEPGTVILLDNVRFHHSKIVTSFCKQSGLELLYTPPYCPWFNPIEYCFSIVKRHFAKHQDISAAFRALCPWHCSAFFAKSLKETRETLEWRHSDQIKV